LSLQCYQKKTHKFGIQIPRTVCKAFEIDQILTILCGSMQSKRKMINVMPAFKILDPEAIEPVGHTCLPCHMIFDVKLVFTCNAQLAAGGDVMDPPSSIRYANVVSCSSICLAFLVAALNDLDILCANAQNMYLFMNRSTPSVLLSLKCPARISLQLMFKCCMV
jgi:hypothetical protein